MLKIMTINNVNILINNVLTFGV